ncbi:DUF3347 domain-containing protein [Mucilaginibacter sp. UR6-1]|uniref:DUF3347 domain-containing protein n=1 Tax=Mucilaginibacter sp. UR6-1 TaxID=1435643 RepID=UPI001E616A67|nr:DUF3347 domain-containing protein [Mucilaginibacter sp. UR6-1]MCC8407771.1 DUF3347 domain-containing protein [Mucilaginibacter sp. UR6-1]
MKTLVYVTALAVASLFLGACKHPKKSNAAKDSAHKASHVKHTAAKPGVDGKVPTPLSGLLVNYLKIKDGLAADNSNEAAAAGTILAEGFAKFDRSPLSASQKRYFDDIAGDAEEMAEHIGKSAGKLPHQREHFDMLSKDMIDLVKAFGTTRNLYIDRCPMYNDQKGALWLSETKAIKNPYLGSAMPTCGAVKEELKYIP